MIKWSEPFLPADLDGLEGTPRDFHSRALYSLAKQLGWSNDFYYPLIDAALMLRPPPLQGLWFWE
jgi:hypothetical protein